MFYACKDMKQLRIVNSLSCFFIFPYFVQTELFCCLSDVNPYCSLPTYRLSPFLTISPLFVIAHNILFIKTFHYALYPCERLRLYNTDARDSNTRTSVYNNLPPNIGFQRNAHKMKKEKPVYPFSRLPVHPRKSFFRIASLSFS
jgi:hypothetical protein